MHSDTFLAIGSTHTMCEDYALGGSNFALVSDGCSGSRDTDVGSRILSYSAATVLSQLTEIATDTNGYDLGQYIGKAVLQRATGSCSSMGILTECLDATLVIAYALPKRLLGLMYGDGYLITIRKDLSVFVLKVSFSATTEELINGVDVKGLELPYYLSYESSSYRRSQYDKYKVECKIEAFKLDAATKELKVINVQSVDPKGSRVFELGDPDDFLSVFTISDGLGSFYSLSEDKIIQNVSDQLIIPKTTNVKRWKGEFVKRRFTKMNKMFETDGIRHYDDLSVTGLYLGE